MGVILILVTIRNINLYSVVHQEIMERKILILSGERGAGKTNICLRLLRVSKQIGLKSTGVVSPGHYVDGKKTGIDVIDIVSNIRRHLANADSLPGEIRTDAYRFDPAVMNWVNNEVIKSCPCDLLIIDELGPLELVRNQGWTNALDVLHYGMYKLAVVVIRPELITVFYQRFSDRILDTITLPPADGIDPVDEIMSAFRSIDNKLEH